MTNLLMKNIVHTESACIKTKTAITYSSTAPLLKFSAKDVCLHRVAFKDDVEEAGG
jgi:hypothetical protein